MITCEDIEKRKAELESNRAQLLANLNAVDGALQDCDYWLNKLKLEQTSVEKK